MKKFITVNRKTSQPKRINVDKIVAYWEDRGTLRTGNKITILCVESYQDLLSQGRLEVHETVAEIDRMINEVLATNNEE